MNPSEFQAPDAGRLIPVPPRALATGRAPNGLWAFVPSDLPPKLEIDLDLANVLSEAALALGGLKFVGERLPNPTLLIRPMLNREALYSSRIEGTVASAEDLALFEVDPTISRSRPSVLEVRNYIAATEQALDRIRTNPDQGTGRELISEIHRILMSGTQRTDELTPGEFRHVQNWIGPSGTRIEDARYVPPPPQEMESSLDALVAYMAMGSEPSLIRLALIHYQFEAIHPFIDGNGRVGRLLTTLLLAKWGLLEYPLLHLSAYFERNYAEYADAMLAVSKTNNWARWIGFFLRGIAEEARAAADRASKLLALRDRYREEIRALTRSPNAPILVDYLFRSPMITVPEAARHLGITYPPAQHIVERLVEGGILNERPDSWPKVYVAIEIIDLADAK